MGHHAPITFSIVGSHLAPIADLIERSDVSEIALNREGEIWFEVAGEAQMRSRPQPEYSAEKLMRLANGIAAQSAQHVSAAHPLLSARIDGVGRVQLALPPVSGEGAAFAIRRAVTKRLSLADYQELGMFEGEDITRSDALTKDDAALVALHRERDIHGFLKEAITAKKNIIVSGGTSSGKTTFANALLAEISAGDRIITIEDTRELTPSQPNHLPLIASRGGQNKAKIDSVGLLEAALRLRPDRIILGELRGAEAYPFIRAINTGHPGAITTIHADTPQGALDQLAFLVLQSGLNLDFAQIRSFVARQIDVIVQLGRVGGERRVETVYFRHAENH